MAHTNDGRLVEVDLLNRLSARCDGDFPPSKHEIEVALELGFASLMSLEAELRIITEDAGTDAYPAIIGRSLTERLMIQIESLRNALAELRARTSVDHSPGLERGFVLPPKPVAL
jgi:phosphohistidine swiveling domain-containing protein